MATARKRVVNVDEITKRQTSLGFMARSADGNGAYRTGGMCLIAAQRRRIKERALAIRAAAAALFDQTRMRAGAKTLAALDVCCALYRLRLFSSFCVYLSLPPRVARLCFCLPRQPTPRAVTRYLVRGGGRCARRAFSVNRRAAATRNIGRRLRVGAGVAARRQA